MGDQTKVKKLTGESWAEILSKIRGSELSIADKVQALDFIAEEATKAANSVRHGDYDGKIHDQSKVVLESLQTSAEETTALMALIRQSKLHKTQAPGHPDLAQIETAMQMARAQMKKINLFYESHSPTIVDRVGAIPIYEAPEAVQGGLTAEDMPF